MEDVVKYTVRALGCSYVVNKQLHIRPRLNQVSQHDLIHIYEDKLFRQQGIGQRLVRAPVSEADLDAQITGDSPLSPRLDLDVQIAGGSRGTASFLEVIRAERVEWLCWKRPIRTSLGVALASLPPTSAGFTASCACPQPIRVCFSPG